MEFIPLITLISELIIFAVLVFILKKIQSNQKTGDFGILENKISTLDGNIKTDFSNNRTEIDRKINELSKSLNDSNNAFRKEITESIKESIKDLSAKLKEDLKDNADNLTNNIDKFNNVQKENFDKITLSLDTTKESINKLLRDIIESVNNKLKDIQESNSNKLDEMRQTVDEKLHKTLEERLGQSFTQVSERLEAVQVGLGEVKGIASNVGDLKSILTNVKTKGNLGEYQLNTILHEMLTSETYIEQAQIKPDTTERVDFAIKIPNKNGTVNGKDYILLPIDSKFPTTDYENLMNAYETSDKDLILSKQKELGKTLREFAKSISEKYIDEPITTNFAIMFLPFEGLYAEALKIDGLLGKLQEDYKITIAGPTTIVAFINSLLMGFKTLAIEKKSSEIFETLGKAKNEFGKFADVIESVRKKITEAGNNLDKIGTRTRSVERSLKNIEKIEFGDKDPFADNIIDADAIE